MKSLSVGISSMEALAIFYGEAYACDEAELLVENTAVLLLPRWRRRGRGLRASLLPL
jgi:hypothetical protein